MATGRGIEAEREASATSGRSTNRNSNTERQGLYGDWARAGNGARSIGSGQGAAPKALLNGLVADAKQEHPRGEGSNSMNSVVGILRLNSTLGIMFVLILAFRHMYFEVVLDA